MVRTRNFLFSVSFLFVSEFTCCLQKNFKKMMICLGNPIAQYVVLIVISLLACHSLSGAQSADYQEWSSSQLQSAKPVFKPKPTSVTAHFSFTSLSSACRFDLSSLPYLPWSLALPSGIRVNNGELFSQVSLCIWILSLLRLSHMPETNTWLIIPLCDS